MKKPLKIFLHIVAFLILALLIWQATILPKNNKDWQVQFQVLPYAEMNGDQVTIYNVRNFKYNTTDDFTVAYYDRTYDLSKLQKVYFIVEPFSQWEASAHTFLSFQFGDDEFVAITIETRLEKGEDYSLLSGVLKQYEIAYVIGDERDVIVKRTNMQKSNVYLYPVKATQAKAQALFLDMVGRATRLKDQPAFYHTFTDSCTSSIVKHINKITPHKVPLSYKYYLPGYSDQLALEIGLLDIDLPIPEARKKYLITDKAQAYGDQPGFSQAIRQF